MCTDSVGSGLAADVEGEETGAGGWGDDADLLLEDGEQH